MTDLGVVDPLRPPASVVAFGGRLRMLPPYAIGFLGIFIARAIADLYTALRPNGDVFVPLSIYSLILGSIPDWLALLTPVAVGWAAVQLGRTQARVIRGAIAVGLSEVVAMGAHFIGGPENPTFAISATVRAVSFVLLAGGLTWMARGLEALRIGTPSALARRGAFLGIALGVAVASIELVARVADVMRFDYSTYPGSEGVAIAVANAVSVSYLLVPLAWAYLASVLVRADRDAGRPVQATRRGATAGWLAIAWLGTSVVGLAWLPFAGDVDAPSPELTMLTSILLVVSVAGAAIALAAIAYLVAGLIGGLASPSESAGIAPDVAPDIAAEPA